MKKLFLTLTVIFTVIFYSCEEEGVEELLPTPQEVEFNISYSGVAHSPYPELCWLYFHVYDETGERYVEEFLYDDDKIRNGKTSKFKRKFEPGIYTTWGWWDWRGNEVYDPYDPVLQEITFEVDGFNKTTFSIKIIDQVSPGDLGWIEGKIICDKDIDQQAPVIVEMTEIDTRERYSKVVSPDHNFSVWDLVYEGPKVPRGDYAVKAFWDLNENGELDAGEPSAQTVPFFVFICDGLAFYEVNAKLE